MHFGTQQNKTITQKNPTKAINDLMMVIWMGCMQLDQILHPNQNNQQQIPSAGDCFMFHLQRFSNFSQS